mmetsp:Transcript_30550/g.58845  ORF Transcript_30550/g.58845 Transcript_30550/m.58845 type:complete len:343 (+) Transcript_30550:191-1219(+)
MDKPSTSTASRISRACLAAVPDYTCASSPLMTSPGAVLAAPSEGPQSTSILKRALEANKMVAAGGIAGAMARTASAPLDRIKLLFQVQHLSSSGLKSDAYTGLFQAFRKIYLEEGLLAFWKGNGTNLVRIIPYSSVQLSANDFYKRQLANEAGELSLPKRLLAGALAGMSATTVGHPLDTVRLRLALPNSGYKGMTDCFVKIVRTEGPLALGKGLPAALAGIAPFAAVNFATYDLMKKLVYGHLGMEQHWTTNMGVGASTGLFAASICYPMDTIRRRMQMRGTNYSSTINCFTTIVSQEGYRALFKGWTANALKVVPQNSIRFVSYEVLKTLLGVEKQKTDT